MKKLLFFILMVSFSLAALAEKPEDTFYLDNMMPAGDFSKTILVFTDKKTGKKVRILVKTKDLEDDKALDAIADKFVDESLR